MLHMHLGENVYVPHGKSKVDHEEILLLAFTDPQQEVVWLDVSVHKAFELDVPNTRDELVCYHQEGLCGKRHLLILEDSFQTLPKDIHHKHVVIFQLLVLIDDWHYRVPWFRIEVIIDQVLFKEHVLLTVEGAPTLQLDGNLHLGDLVHCLHYPPKPPMPQLFDLLVPPINQVRILLCKIVCPKR